MIVHDLTVREPIPPHPWHVECYGNSLAQVKDANGQLILDGINVALAEYIVYVVSVD